MSLVFSIASHSALQYLPFVTVQEQTGCAHFLPFSEAILFPFFRRHEDVRHVLLTSPLMRDTRNNTRNK